MFIFPQSVPGLIPRVRLGSDGNVFVDVSPFGFMVMETKEAERFRDGLIRVLDANNSRQSPPVIERRRPIDDARKAHHQPPPLFPGRATPEGRTDFDKEDDATGA